MVGPKLNPETAREDDRGRVPMMMGGAFACTIVSTFTLAVLPAAREGANALVEKRPLRHFLIISGHDVAQRAVPGATPAVRR